MAMKIKIDPEGMARIEVNASKAVGSILNDIAEDAKRLVPKDTMELHDSIHVEFKTGDLQGSVVAGTDHWAPTEYGSGPHTIEAKGDYSLTDGAGEYYGRQVNHPGTPEQPFLRPALYKKRDVRDAN